MSLDLPHKVINDLGDAEQNFARIDDALATVDDMMPWLILVNVQLWPTDVALKTGTWTTFVNANAQTYGYVANSPNAQNDEIGVDVALAAGQWLLSVMYVKTSASGICTVNLDGQSQGTFDQYAAVTAYNQTATVTFTVSSTGKHRVSFKAAAKNGASTGYQLSFELAQLRRTS